MLSDWHWYQWYISCLLLISFILIIKNASSKIPSIDAVFSIIFEMGLFVLEVYALHCGHFWN